MIEADLPDVVRPFGARIDRRIGIVVPALAEGDGQCDLPRQLDGLEGCGVAVAHAGQEPVFPVRLVVGLGVVADHRDAAEQHPVRIDRIAPVQAERMLVARIVVRVRRPVGAVIVLVAKRIAQIDDRLVVDDLADLRTAADARIEQPSTEVDHVAQRVDPQRRALPVARIEGDARARLDLRESEVEVGEVELPGAIARQPRLPPFAVGRVEIVAVDQGPRQEGVEVVVRTELVVELEVGGVPAEVHLDLSGIRARIRIGLIAKAAEDRAREHVPRRTLVDLGQQRLDAVSYRLGYFR